MKKVILALLMLCMVSSIAGQERKVLNISDSVSVIRQTDHNGQEFEGLLHGIKSMDGLHDVYGLDIFSYYDISECDTELKRKNYKNSSKGKQLIEELKKKKQSIVNSKLYYIIPFNINLGDKEYNLKTRTFDFGLSFIDNEYYPIHGYLNFPKFVIKCPISLKQQQRKMYVAANKHYYYDIVTKIPMSEQVATQIEENISNLGFVIELNIQNIRTNTRKEWLYVWENYVIQGVASKIYIINENTNEIYFSL